MGVIFGTMFFLMFARKWVHHFRRSRRRGGINADDGVGIPIGAALVAQQMAFLAALLPYNDDYVWATTNGWWYLNRCAGQQRDAESRRDHSQHNLFRPVCDRRRLCGLAAPRPAAPAKVADPRAQPRYRSWPVHGGGVRHGEPGSYDVPILNGWSNVRAFRLRTADDVSLIPMRVS